MIDLVLKLFCESQILTYTIAKLSELKTMDLVYFFFSFSFSFLDFLLLAKSKEDKHDMVTFHMILCNNVEVSIEDDIT